MNRRPITMALLLCGVAAAHSAALAQDELTGMFRLTRTATDIVGPQLAQALNEKGIVGLDEGLQWQVYVPESYDRQRPPGVFVFIDPNGYGGMPDQWQQVFTSHNMIWVGAKFNERRPTEEKRVWQAILGSRAIGQDYSIDLNRLYLGSSGPAAATAVNTLLFANEFVGAVYMKGSLHWTTIEAEQLERLRRKHHVFITGTNDRAKDQIRRDYENYRKDGVTKVKLIFATDRIGNMPEPEHMDEAIRFLDTRLMQ